MLKNSAIFDEISKNGFAAIDANLTVETEKISSFISSNFKLSFSHFYYSLLENSFEQNKHIRSHFKGVLYSFCETNFKDYRTITESFLIKPANTSDELLLHQDWCYTDEKKYSAYNIWIPLSDVTAENGAMFFLPGSQLWFDNLRSGSLLTGRVSKNSFPKEQIVTVNLKKGQALIFHPAVFHGSNPNYSSQDRTIITMTILQKEAPFLYFQQSENKDAVRVFNLDDDAFIRDLKILTTRGNPDSPEIKRLNYTHHIITEAELLTKLVAQNS